MPQQATKVKRDSKEYDVEQFVATTAHDLQEPLRTIACFATLLQRRHGTALVPEAAEYVERIRDGALRMSRLVADLLTFGEIGRIAGGDASLVDLAVPVSQSTRDLTAMLSEAGAEVSWCDLPTVLVLPEQMELLFQNLISNGVRYRGTQAPRIRISARSQGKEYVITVEDNGQGIQPEFLEAIFRPFRRLHTSEISGTGLGLAIAKRIVDNHAGRIWVDSTPGVGSAFHFTLPKRHNLEAEEENANS